MVRYVVAAILALSCWTGVGVLAVSDVAGKVRLGLLPPVWVAALLAVCVAAVLTWRRVSPRVLAPVVVAGLCLLPWLPLPVPGALLLWTGPLAALPWLGACVSGFSAWVEREPAAARLSAPRSATAVAFVAALAIYGGGYVLVSDLHPGGDEPHYLMISQSLLKDGDLRIQNNHDNREYADFFPGTLPPDFLRRGTDGQIYSIHAPGLPVLILPAYALLGAPGAVAFLILVSAAGSALLWRVAYDVTRHASAAWVAWAGAALAVPFVFHTFAVFPDGPASVLALIGVHGLVRATRGDVEPGRGYWLLVGAALACLPWLHTRYAIIAALLGFALAATLVRRPRGIAACAAFLAVPVAAAAAWFGYFWLTYGTASPSAPYGGYTQTAIANLLPGVTGLLFDGQFGLVATAPILAWAAIGLVKGLLACKRDETSESGRVVSVTLIVMSLSYLAASGAYQMWWGGASAPARFVVPLVLPLGVPLAVAWASARARATRALMLGALTVSLFLTVAMLAVEGGRLAYNDRDGVALWAAWASPVVDLARALPGIHRGSAGAALAQALVWIGAVSFTWLLLFGLERRAKPGTETFALVAPLAIGLGAMMAVEGAWRVVSTPPGLPSSQARLLGAIGQWPGALGVSMSHGVTAFSRASTRSPSPFLSELRLPGVSHGSRSIVLPPLPAGRYQVVATARGRQSGALSVQIGSDRLAAATLDFGPRAEAGDSRTIDLAFPVAVPRWSVTSLSGREDMSVDVVVRPLDLMVPAGGLRQPARQAVRYDPLIVFFMDDGAYPEPGGFWIRPGREVTVVVGQPDGASPLRVAMHNVPVANRVEVAAGKWHDAVALEPGADRTMVTPPGAGRAIVLRLRAQRGAKPSDVEPGSHDHRELGAWIRLER